MSLFQSAADVYGARVLGVVMTGMGSDGREGAAWIKAKGGTVLTEAEESCVVYGMPRSVVEAGLSDGEVALERHGRRDAGARMSAQRFCSSTIRGWRGAARAQILESAGYEVVEAEDGMVGARAVLPREAGSGAARSGDEGHERPRRAGEAARDGSGARA